MHAHGAMANFHALFIPEGRDTFQESWNLPPRLICPRGQTSLGSSIARNTNLCWTIPRLNRSAGSSLQARPTQRSVGRILNWSYHQHENQLPLFLFSTNDWSLYPIQVVGVVSDNTGVERAAKFIYVWSVGRVPSGSGLEEGGFWMVNAVQIVSASTVWTHFLPSITLAPVWFWYLWCVHSLGVGAA